MSPTLWWWILVPGRWASTSFIRLSRPDRLCQCRAVRAWGVLHGNSAGPLRTSLSRGTRGLGPAGRIRGHHRRIARAAGDPLLLSRHPHHGDRRAAALELHPRGPADRRIDRPRSAGPTLAGMPLRSQASLYDVFLAICILPCLARATCCVRASGAPSSPRGKTSWPQPPLASRRPGISSSPLPGAG